MKNISIFTLPAAVLLLLCLLLAVVMSLAGCTGRKAEAQTAGSVTPVQAQIIETSAETTQALSVTPEQDGDPKVFFTSDISSAGLMAVYEALGLAASGNVAVKVHTGEPGNTHYVKPELMRELVQKVNGTIVETNTAYGGRRASTAAHYQVARDHGFTAIAPVVILDETRDISLPVSGGSRLTENFVGERFNEFDFHIVLSHFKGHQSGGFGGALKNTSIGYASAAGKSWIHSGGLRRTGFSGDQNAFLESMAEAAKSVIDRVNGRILYINVMNHLSVDCDCNGRPSAPTMADIGILASLDPVALDQACIDLVYAAPDSRDLIRRIESRNGLLTIDHAEKIGAGSKTYQLVQL
jgi:uncharacterized Fe-S center protein